MTQNSKTGAAFITGGTIGTIAGAGISATVGGMGLAGGFGAVGIGATPVVAAGAVAGAAAYGTINVIAISPDGNTLVSGSDDRKVIYHKEYTQVDEFRLLCETLRERSTVPLIGECHRYSYQE